MRGGTPNQGSGVNINANPDDFLDWDAPLTAAGPGLGRRQPAAEPVAGEEEGRRRATGRDIWEASRSPLRGKGTWF